MGNSEKYQSVTDEIKNTLHLLQQEKEEDLRQYQRLVLNTSLDQKRSNGMTWYPLNILKSTYKYGQTPFLEVERTAFQDQPHAFQSGKVIALFSNLGGNYTDQRVNAVVNYVQNNRMGITLNSYDLPDWINTGKLGADLLFDEASYREMENVLQYLLKLEKGRAFELRNILLGAVKPVSKTITLPEPSTGLNSSQQEAVNRALMAQDLAVIHGPPGTGKTTTMVEAILQHTFAGNKILTCAPSNAAVDLLVEKLAARSLSILRLGHPARITEEVIPYTLDFQVSNHGYYKDLKKLRKQAEEFRTMGHKYKRNFGAREKEQRKLLLAEARSCQAEADQLEFYIVNSLIQNTQVIASTLTGASLPVVQNKSFDVVFIDEGSQALEPSCWIPIMKAAKVVFAGDHYQLPPTIKNHEAAKGGLAETLFQKSIQRNPETACLLEVQYRMNEPIMAFSNQVFYQNRLKADISVKDHRLTEQDQPLIFIDTAGTNFQEQLNPESGSISNPEEARFLIWFLQEFLEISAESLQFEDFSAGIISPYREQVILLNELLKNSPMDEELKKRITVDTVDAFQGREREMILISLVRSNSKTEIGFLKEIRRTNVAMTRARKKLVMIGDSATLGSDPFFQNMLAFFSDKDAYQSVYEYSAYLQQL